MQNAHGFQLIAVKSKEYQVVWKFPNFDPTESQETRIVGNKSHSGTRSQTNCCKRFLKSIDESFGEREAAAS